MDDDFIRTHWYELLLELSGNYTNLKGVVTMLIGAWPLQYTRIPISEIYKVEDDLVERGVLSRRVELEDSRTEYLYEGEEVVRDIKFHLWNVLYNE